LKAYSPDSDSAVFYRNDDDGLFVWRRNLETTKTEKLLEANTFLRGIAPGRFKLIEYTGLDGEKLKAWLILPPDYQPGRRYPLLTWVYPGSMAGPAPSRYDQISAGGSLNMQIPAAHGYVVLMPSMPLGPEGATDDPMLRLQDGVLPAVDKVVDIGIADPERLFLIGQSFGGFATYGLVTQTHRFTAAVSLAGMSDLISLYGQFDARVRYTDHPQEYLPMMALMESAQIRMGNPPWKDLGRYLRNSPIFYVDRVQTPLMIIQGDLDYVAIQQGEEFFNALYRQGKRAEFVRYWGEGHVLQSPANIRDMWQRIFAWFDEFSPKSAKASGQGHPHNVSVAAE
jgi:dipeptidyl aminopeptidase/acylaminoacyl peptidase